MPIYNRKTFEIAIISEMDKLCNPVLPNPISFSAASIHDISMRELVFGYIPNGKTFTYCCAMYLEI